MPRGVRSKATITPPTIRERAIEGDDKTLTGAPEPSVQTSTAKPTPPPLREIYEGDIREARMLLHQEPVNVDRAQLAVMSPTVPTVVLTEDRIVNIHAPTPLLTFHLRRVENELTDTLRTVHIPSPASIQPGERVVIHVYREA